MVDQSETTTSADCLKATAVNPLEIEATILGLKAASEAATRERDVQACARAMRLIRALSEAVAAKRPTYDAWAIEELARGIQIAHAAWVEMGSPGAWETELQEQT